MLQYKSIYPKTLELLKGLMQNPSLTDFALAGGTGLSLQIGHRISIDIDLFSQNSFDNERLITELNRSYKVNIFNQDKNSLSLTLNDINVDIITYSYPFLKNIIENDSEYDYFQNRIFQL